MISVVSRYIVLLIILSNSFCFSQIEWVRHMPDIGNLAWGGFDISVNGNDNVFMSGDFEGTQNFDGVLGSNTINSGDYGTFGFVQSIFPSSHSNWTTILAPLDSWRGLSYSHIDNHNDYVVLTGRISGEVAMDWDSTNQWNDYETSSEGQLFIAKYNNIGGLVWSKNFAVGLDFLYSGGMVSNQINDMKVDSKGNIYLVGHMHRSMDVDPSPNQVVIQNSQPMIDLSADAFIAKYSSSGDFEWVHCFGNSDHDLITTLEIDGNDNVYIGGYFSTDAGSGPIGLVPTALNEQGFVAKYDNNGVVVWANVMDMRCQYWDNEQVPNHIRRTLDLEIGTDSSLIVSSNYSSDFKSSITKLTLDGDTIWNTTWQSFAMDIFSITTTKDQDIYFTGTFDSDMDFDPGPNTAFLETDHEQTFLGKLNAAGDFVSIEVIDIEPDRRFMSLESSNNKHVYWGVQYEGVLDFPSNMNHQLSYSSTGTSRAIIKISDVDNEHSICGEDYNIYPNPVGNMMFIENLSKTKYDITISDEYGNVVLNSRENIGSIQLNTEHLSAGVYFVKFTSEVCTSIEKVMIL